MTEPGHLASRFSLRTVWARSSQTPLRRFLRTETASAAVLLAATQAAPAWANTDPSSYAATWRTGLSVRVGSASLSADLQEWINSGPVAFFFLVARQWRAVRQGPDLPGGRRARQRLSNSAGCWCGQLRVAAKRRPLHG
jgi:Na+/H+ antiporter 1